MQILLIDNYDSFTYNLAHLLTTVLDRPVHTVLHDRVIAHDINAADVIVISPGPGHPAEYTYINSLITLGKPIFGICLGMQMLNLAFGGKVSRLDNCKHGVTQKVIFNHDRQQHEVAVYNSLYCSQMSPHFNVTAQSEDLIPMAIEHQTMPFLGYQFHPESFLTKNGGYFIDHAFNHFFKHHNN